MTIHRRGTNNRVSCCGMAYDALPEGDRYSRNPERVDCTLEKPEYVISEPKPVNPELDPKDPATWAEGLLPQIQEIRALAAKGDSEAAHFERDEFLLEVLRLIATAPTRPTKANLKTLAQYALDTENIYFTRWMS